MNLNQATDTVTPSTGTLNVSGAVVPTTAVAVANGGTGQTTASAGFNAISPITTTGDLIIGNGTNSATRLAIGTNAYVLTSNGTTATWAAAGGGGGVTGFTSGENTTAPNATVYVDYLQASAASTDADVAFIAKGAGATLASIPDNTATGGNKRGTYATDWQKSRSVAAHVAAGNYSVIGGGQYNKTTAVYGTVSGGYGNATTGSYATVGGGNLNNVNQNYSGIFGGSNNTISQQYSFIGGGSTNTSSSPYSFVGGGGVNAAQTAATGYNVVVGGANNQATGDYSFVGGGGDAVTATNRNTASGTNSVVVGGSKNTASGDYSFIGSGGTNTASGLYAMIVGGTSSTISGNFAGVLGGYSHNVSQTNAVAIGGNTHNISGVNSGVFCGVGNTISFGNTSSVILGGDTHTTSSNYSVVLGGKYGSTRGIDGYVAIPASVSPITTTLGVSQLGLLLLGVQTTDATATVLRSNTSAAGTTNQVILPNNSAYYFKGSVIANVTGAANGASWDFSGAIMRGATAGSTVFIGTPMLNRVGATAGATAWSITLTTDTTNGGLAVTVTGAAATTIRWVAKIETTEVTY